MVADLDAISFDRIVEPFDNAAFGEFLIRFENKDLVVRENKLEANSKKEFKIILIFICVEFTALLIINNFYKLISLINLYRS